LSALVSRAKGRDFYDALFLLSQTKPDYNFLAKKQDIHNLMELSNVCISLIHCVPNGTFEDGGIILSTNILSLTGQIAAQLLIIKLPSYFLHITKSKANGNNR
jgi:hypothetical protein